MVSNLYKRSVLVAVEGIDGAGKTTQVWMLARSLQAAGLDPIVSKEPTDSYWGQKIRISATNGRLSLEEELNAFINDRTEHVQKLIRPALDAGRIVILDRYFYSTIAYQGSRGASVAMLQAEMQSRFPVPDAVFLLDLDPAVAVSRIRTSRKDVPNEFERVEGLERARDVFNSLPGPITRIDGSMSIEAVHRIVIESFVHGPLRAKHCAQECTRESSFHGALGPPDNQEWQDLSCRLLSELEQPVGEHQRISFGT